MSGNRNLIAIGVALVLGLVFGAALSSRNNDVEASFTRRVSALDDKIAAGFGAVDARLSAIESSVADIVARAGEAAGQAGETALRFDAIDAALAALGEQVDALDGKVAGMTAVGAAGPAVSAPGPLALGVGQAADIGGQRLFVSRIDPEAREVTLMIMRRGPAVLGLNESPLALGNGCSVTLDSVEGRTAHLTSQCGQ
jgi:hypothetical protein